MIKICALLTLLFGSIDFLLHSHFKKTETARYLRFKKEFFGQTVYIIPLLFLAMAYSYFLADREMWFVCDKETMQCTYSHSTEFDKKMRVAEKYDLALVNHASTARHSRGRRSRYYTVDLKGKDKFKIPYDFSSSSSAEAEADRINRFLNSDQQRYEFMVLASDLSFGREIGVVAVLILPALFILIFFRMLSDMRKDALGIADDVPENEDGAKKIHAGFDHKKKKQDKGKKPLKKESGVIEQKTPDTQNFR